MSKLTLLDRSRIRSHLGYDRSAAIPAAAAIRLQYAFDADYSDWQLTGINGIRYWLDRCDRYLIATDPTQGDQFTTRTLIIGDVNRSTTTTTVADLKNWWGEYLEQTDQLANKLSVPNFRRILTSRNLFVRWGDDYIKSIPGAPDNAVGDRIWSNLNCL
jgi:hypothetical protein